MRYLSLSPGSLRALGRWQLGFELSHRRLGLSHFLPVLDFQSLLTSAAYLFMVVIFLLDEDTGLNLKAAKFSFIYAAVILPKERCLCLPFFFFKSLHSFILIL